MTTTQDDRPDDVWGLGPTVKASPALAAALLGLPAPGDSPPGDYTGVYVTIKGERVLLSESKG